VSAETSRHPSLDELSAWVDGEITGAYERDVLAEHVAACSTCASLVEDFRALAAAQVSAPVPPVPFPLQGRVLDRLAAERFGRRPARRVVLPLSVAATLLIGVVAVWLYRQQPAPRELATIDTMEQREAAPEPVVPAPQPPPAQEAPQALEEQPLQKAAPPAESVPAPTRTFKREQPREKAKDEFAPVPPAMPQTGQVRQDSNAMARQEGVALQTPTAHWVRLPVSAVRKEAKATGKIQSEAAQAAPAAPAPSAEGDARDFEASAAAQPCAARSLLQPPLSWPDMDADRARAAADRARAAGASDVVLATAPQLRLTLVLPVQAWPAVQDVLGSSGIAIPDAVRAAPEGGGCLEVAIDAVP